MKRKAVASKLADWQQQDAARLKKLLESAKDGPNRLTVDSLADMSGVGSASFVSQLTSAYRPIGFEHALKLAKALRVAVEEISPTHAAALAGAPRSFVGDPPPSPPPATNGINERDRATLGALKSLDPAVRESFHTLIGTVAAAANERHAEFMRRLEALNAERDGKTKNRIRKGARIREE